MTVISDLENHCLLEVIDSHKAEEITEALKSLWTEEDRLLVEEVSIDMWAGFTKVVREVFPNAKVVYDRFHVMQMVIKELNKIRRQSGVEEKGARRLILKNREDLKEEEQQKLEGYLSQSKRLRQAYEWKEELREIYETEMTVSEGEVKMKEWLNRAKTIYGKVIQTIRTHLEGICQYFANRVTSGMMEGINNRIKLIKRQGYGFTNIGNFRARLLAVFWP